MARAKLGDSESKRLQMVITEDELKAVEDWRFKNRVQSKSDAIRRLVQIGLRMDREMPKLIKSAVDAIANSEKTRTKSGVLPLDMEKSILEKDELNRKYVMKLFRKIVEIANEVDPLLHDSALHGALKETERRKNASGEALAILAAKLRDAAKLGDNIATGQPDDAQ